MTKVTKHPGRIQAGKKLVEWNKQKRLNEQVKKNIIPPPTEPEQTTPEPEQRSYVFWIIVGAGAVGVILWKGKNILWPKKRPIAKVEQVKSLEPKNLKPDPFHMV